MFSGGTGDMSGEQAVEAEEADGVCPSGSDAQHEQQQASRLSYSRRFTPDL